jgi:Cu/Ag efflux protein CusF
MRQFLLCLFAAIAVAGAGYANAQAGAVVVGQKPGAVGAAQTIKTTATITAIDKKTRDVTLKGEDGKEFTVQAGPRVKNFAQMKVGDVVNVQYVEALTLELKKGGGQPVAMTEQADAARAKSGKMPAGMVGRKVTVVADVVDVDPATQTVTLRGPQRTVDVKVQDPERFKQVAKGDQVQATYTEALAVVVERVKPAKSAKAPAKPKTDAKAKEPAKP